MIFSLLPANLLSMRSLNVSKPLQGAKQPFSTNSSPAQPQSNTTVSIPVESSNQALAKVIDEQKQEQDSSKKSKWYQEKWKYFTGLGAGAATGIQSQDAYSTTDFEKTSDFNFLRNKVKKDKLEFAKLELEFEQLFGTKLKDLFTIESYKLLISNLPEAIKSVKFFINHGKERIATSYDAQTKDPNLYNLFLKIKDDLGITENIQLRIGNYRNAGLQGGFAGYSHPFKTIMISEDYNQIKKELLIFTLAHELGHVQQYFHYPEIYHIPTHDELIQSMKKGIKSKTNIHRKAETSADANAAGYFDCPECLKSRRDNIYYHPLAQYDPLEEGSKDFTVGGYFSPQDYDSYIQRAYLDGQLCQGHKLLGTPKDIDRSIPKKHDSFYQAKQAKNYLNKKYNQSLDNRNQNLPAELFLPKSATNAQ